MATVRASAPRFRRYDLERNTFLTDDDRKILEHVYRHRLIDAQSIYSLFPNRSQQQFSRRLHALFHEGYLSRPPQQLIRHERIKGSRPLVYALDRKGAREVSAQTGKRVSTFNWLQKNRNIKWWNIEHMLSTTQFMVQLEVAIKFRDDLSLIRLDEILAVYAPESTRRSAQPERFRTPVTFRTYSGEEGIAPDRIFGIRSGDQESFFFLEIDEGTETIEPSTRRQRPSLFFRQSSILKKFVTYANAHAERAHQKHFGIPSFRILTVTTTPRRAGNMAEVCGRHIGSGALAVRPGFFLFSDRETLKGCASDALNAPYLNGFGKEKRGAIYPQSNRKE
ncbi:MAG: replication-relaxation family protein [Gammaproteobacteria bacterium]|jgi:hypothetical protein